MGRKEFRPKAARWDEYHEYPWENVHKLREAKMREKTRDEWLRLFEAAKLPCGPVLNLSEVFADENVNAREMLFTLDHPVKGEIKQLEFPFKFSQTPADARLRPPLLGEHNQEVLKWAGYSDRQIENLKADRAL